jgi:hypothetical protein
MEKFFASLRRLLEPRTPPAAESAGQPTADRPPPLPEPVRSSEAPAADVVPAAADVLEVKALLEAVAEAPVAAPEPVAQPPLLAPEPTPVPPLDEGPVFTPASDQQAVDVSSPAPVGAGDALVLTLATPPATFTIAKSSATLGRGPENPIRLDDLSVSRRHARIAYRQGGYWLSDLGSMGGTWVDGARLSAPRRIAAGEVIDIGHCRLTVSFAGVSATKTASNSRAEMAGQTRRRR